jgi:YidC/Oxa1 family membrane protein insertase
VNPLQLLEDPLRALLDFLHENCNLTYGWSIVVLTVIVRTAMLPLVIKQYSSMRGMQMVAPQLKELQRKYKGNRQKLQEETMAFYKQNEINPFASCLPLVAQIPIFIALYYVLRGFSEEAVSDGGSLSFMWLVNDVRVDFTSIGWGVYVLLLIYALSQLLSTELSFTPNMPDNQRRLMRLLPLAVVFFVWQFPVPAGLVLYWMTTNLWTAGQQLVMRHRIGLHLADPVEVAKYEAANQKKGSRTAAKDDEEETDDDAQVEVEADSDTPTRTTPRKRRRRAPAPQAEAAIAEEAEVAEEAEEAEPAPADDSTDVEPETPPAPAPKSAGRGANGSGARRRQPRSKGTAKGSRPAGSSRSKKKKR